MSLKFWKVLALFFLIMAVVLFVSVWTQFGKDAVVEANSPYYAVIVKYQILLQALICILFFSWALFKRSFISEALWDYSKIGQSSSLLSKFSRNKSDIKKVAASKLPLFSLVIIFDIVFGGYEDWFTINMSIMLISLWFVSVCIQMRFALLTKRLCNRIDVMNYNLVVDCYWNDIGKLEKMLSLYSRLIDSAHRLNYTFSFHILLLFLNNFVMMTSSSYLMLEVIPKSSNITASSFNIQIGFFLQMFSKIIFRCNEIWAIVSSCATLINKANNFNSNLYRILIEDKTEQLANNNKLYLHIAMKKEILFTASGLFVVDYQFIHSMLAAATTYLVILIQLAPNNVYAQATNF